MKSVVKVFLALCCLAFVLGAEAMIKLKPWTEWSLKDARNVLTGSPWGQTQTNTDTSQMTVAFGRSSDHRATSVKIRICFLSAKPIRQAFARIAQLDVGANTPEQVKAATDFIDSKFSNTIVVAVDYEVTDPVRTGDMYQALASATTNMIKNSTYLELRRGGKVFLQEYQPKKPNGVGSLFIFPRFVDGKPFIDPKFSHVRFYSDLPNTSLNLDMTFKIADLMFEGVLEY